MHLSIATVSITPPHNYTLSFTHRVPEVEHEAQMAGLHFAAPVRNVRRGAALPQLVANIPWGLVGWLVGWFGCRCKYMRAKG